MISRTTIARFKAITQSQWRKLIGIILIGIIMAKAKPAIIAYDITCSQRRQKVQRKLQKWRLQGQYSLIECYLTLRDAEAVLAEVIELMDSTEDKLALIWVHPQIKAQGLGSAVIELDRKIKIWS